MNEKSLVQEIVREVDFKEEISFKELENSSGIKIQDQWKSKFFKRLRKEYLKDITLEEYFSRMIKKELFEIGKRLNITLGKSLRKKELIKRITEEYSIGIKRQLGELSQEDKAVLKELYNEDGYKVIEDYETSKYSEFVVNGLCISGCKDGEYVASLSNEARWAIESEFSIEEDNGFLDKKVLDKLRDLLYFYGAIDLKDLKRILREYRFEEISEKRIKNMVAKDSLIGEREGIIFIAEENEIERLLEKQRSSVERDYFVFPEKILQDKGREESLENFKYIINHIKRHYRIDKRELEEFLLNTSEEIRAGMELNDVVKRMFFQFPVKGIEEGNVFAGLISDMYQGTRQWKLKGYSHKLLQGSDFKGRKVGRNEKCPCGSGKKFKRCCGKN